jgi:hypothetical protein
MPDAVNCLRCHTPMEIGYLADVLHGTAEVWKPGAPKMHWWGVEGQMKKGIAVHTRRCPTCGTLESFTPMTAADGARPTER